MKITELSLKRPVAVIVLVATAVLLGLISFVSLPVNLLPDITYPMVKVYINWRGATPEDIENNIADVVEQKMATVDNLDYLDSQCTDGLYTLLVNFKEGTNVDIAYQDTLAKMGLVKKQLPKDASEPMIFKADPSQLPVIDLLITSEKLDSVKLRTWVENYLQQQFTGVPGSAGTEVSGGAKREIRVYLDSLKVQMLGLNPDKIAQRLAEENIEQAGGLVTTEKKEFTVRTKGYFKSIDEIKNIIIMPGKDGQNIYLKDIATIKDTSDIQRVITKLNAKEGVKLSVFKQAEANTLDVETGIKKRIEELKKILPAGVKLDIIYNQADYIRAANKGVRDAAIIAALLVILVTWFFLGHTSHVLVILLSMPVSLLLTFAFMKLMGFSVNILSLGGLVLAITVILDQSVIVLENIVRLQHEKNAANKDMTSIVLKGSNEVSSALMFAVMTFVALFLPFLLVPGLVSLLFHELILIIAAAISFSMLVAITITPSLSNALLEKTDKIEKKQTYGDIVIEKLKHLLTKSLTYALERRKLFIWLTIGLFVIGMMLFTVIGSEFLPKADDGMITVKVKMPTGTSLQITNNIISNIEKKVKDLPYIENYSSLIGGKVWGLVTYEIANEGEVDIQLVPKSKRGISTDDYVKKYADDIQKSAGYPGAKVMVMHTKMKGIRMTGDFDIEIELHAPKTVTPAEMYALAAKISSMIKDVKGVSNLSISIDVTKPEYHFIPDRNRLVDIGISEAAVSSNIKTLVDGKVAGSYYESGYYYPIRVVADEKTFKGKEDVGNMPIFMKKGLFYLRDLGTIKTSVGPVEIDRIDQMRVIKVTASVIGADVGKTSSEVYRMIKDIKLPAGCFIKAGGQAQMMRENFKTLGFILLMALFFAYVILAIQFESLILPLLILSRIPLSVIGISVALFITNTPVGVTVLIGVLLLSGIEIVHGVILITFIQELIAAGEKVKEAVLKGAELRLRPVLMTAMVGILGLVPLAFGWGEGTELLKPMAIGVIGGLIFSIYLTFYYMPIVFMAIMENKNK